MTNHVSPHPEHLDTAVLKLAGILILGALAPLLDSTVVNVALHTLGHDLHASLSAVQWVSSGYLLALVVAVPLTGWAQSRFGGKRAWLTALALFLLGSVLSGASWNIQSLVVFRVIQGLAAGLLMTLVATMILQAANGRGIGRLMAVVTIPALLGPILGPVVGGLILGHASWRWIFYLNVPICLVALVLAWRALPGETPRRAARLDWIGMLLLAPGLAGIIYGLTQIAAEDGVAHARVLVPLLAGAVLVAAFIAHAVRAAHPLIDLRLFRTRSFAVSCALLFTSGLALFGSLLLVPIYFQQLRGETVVVTGLLLVPQGLGSLAARPIGAVVDRIGARPVVVGGLVLTAAAALGFAFAGRNAPVALLSASLFVLGFGISSTNMGVMVGAYRDLRGDQIPHGSSTTRIVQQLGGAFGASVVALILQHQLVSHPSAGPAAAFSTTFIWLAAFAVAAVVPALLLPRPRSPRSPRRLPALPPQDRRSR